MKFELWSNRAQEVVDTIDFTEGPTPTANIQGAKSYFMARKMLKEKDFLWALSFAGGAAQSALESKLFGLEKVPEKNALESNGSYFYNIVEFKQI